MRDSSTRKEPRRPRVQKMPDSAFFEDESIPSVGDTRRRRPLWIVTSALLVFLVAGYFAYSNLYIVFPGEVPDTILSAALEANTLIANPTQVVGYRTPDGYKVLILEGSGSWAACVRVLLTRSGEVQRVVNLFGDPRPSQMVTFAAGVLGMVAGLAGLWLNRQEIVTRLRGGRIRTRP